MIVESDVFNLRNATVIHHLKTLSLDSVNFARDLTRPSPSICQGVHPSALSIAGSSYRDWRFQTVIPRVQGNYFEEWEVNFGDDTYILNQRCLHLYILNVDTRKEKEIFALHSEPSLIKDGTLITEFKRNPHVHFKTSPSPISKIHLPLNLLDIEEGKLSFELLDNYFKLAIEMLIGELDRFPERDWNNLSAAI